MPKMTIKICKKGGPYKIRETWTEAVSEYLEIVDEAINHLIVDKKAAYSWPAPSLAFLIQDVYDPRESRKPTAAILRSADPDALERMKQGKAIDGDIAKCYAILTYSN